MPVDSPRSSANISLLITAGLWLVLIVAIAKLWVAQLPSGFWVDEMVTAFVVNHPGDPSLAVAPQVPQSIYYWLPKFAQEIGGTSETVYRLPSVIALLLALPLFGWLAARLIHPRAAWFAVFACFGLRSIDYHAADARPYALGMLVSGAALCFLVRWLDSRRWADAIGFIVFGALLWRVHLIYWPFYLVFAFYVVVRISRGETKVTWRDAIVVFAVLTVTLIPVILSAIALLREAHAHVIAEVPDFRALQHEIRWSMVVVCGAAAWLMGKLLGWIPPGRRVAYSALALIGAWWLLDPLVLYCYSHLTGNSVFIDRYVSIAVPGIALAATAAAAYFIPDKRWPVASLTLGLIVLVIAGQWGTFWVQHEKSDWKGAAHEVNSLVLNDGTPVIVPSPFIEARNPVWTPDYLMPGFLYSHLAWYPLKGKVYLFPFDRTDAKGIEYAQSLAAANLAQSERFLIYGVDNNVNYWTAFFAAQTQLRGWKHRIDQHGNIFVGVFTK